MKVLITSIGRRVELIEGLKENLEIIGVDCSFENVGKKFVDKFYKIPKCNEERYIEKLFEISKGENIQGIIPLYEEEFNILIKNRKLFEKENIKLILSDEKVINTFKDKERAFNFLIEKAILTPLVYKTKYILPAIVKPRDGMGSKDIFICNKEREVDFFKEYVKNSIVQEYIDGDEYTVDALCDFNGKPIFIVPRLRVEVRSGEVSKSKSIKDRNLIELTKKIIGLINKDLGKLIGPQTFQFIKRNEEYYFLELNPRFGGGVPLTFESGCNYGQAILKMLKGEILEEKLDFKETFMMRYDKGVYKND